MPEFDEKPSEFFNSPRAGRKAPARLRGRRNGREDRLHNGDGRGEQRLVLARRVEEAEDLPLFRRIAKGVSESQNYGMRKQIDRFVR